MESTARTHPADPVTPEALRREMAALERRLTLKMGALVLLAFFLMAVLDVVV